MRRVMQRLGDPTTTRRRAAAMLLALILTAAATVLAMSFLASQTPIASVRDAIPRQARARAIAESGLAHAVSYVQRDPDWRDVQTPGVWVASAAYDGGSYSIVGDDEDGDFTDDLADAIQFTVTGSFEGVTHTVRATVTPSVTAEMMLTYITADAKLSDTDQAMKRLCESWGFSVTTVRDGASPPEYEAALAYADVVLIAPDVSPGQVAARVVDLPIGIVTGCHSIHKDLRFSRNSDGSSSVNVGLTIKDNSHYITQPLTLGRADVAGVVGMVELRGRLADGLEVLATDASDREPVLAVMEVGAEASDGTPVAGRRVAVGFGGTQFDPRQLNATAETLIQRSLQWAASGGGGVDDGLVAHWRFDERGGLVANDSGKHNLDASLVDMDPGDTWRPGHYSNAAKFDGSGQYMMVPDHDKLDLTTAGTIAAWVYVHRHRPFAGIVHKGGQRNFSDEGYSLQFWTSNRIALAYHSTDHRSNIRDGRTRLRTGRWYHVAGSWGDSGMRVYVDGRLERTNKRRKTAVNSPGSLQIGAQLTQDYNNWYKNFPFEGLLDDVRIYNRQLADREITELYAMEEQVELVAPELVASYDFVEPPATEAQRVSDWAFDDTDVTGSGGGLAVGDRIEMRHRTMVDRYDRTAGPYGGANAGGGAYVSVNTTAPDQVRMTNSAAIEGSLLVGPGGDPDAVMYLFHDARVVGEHGAQLVEADVTPAGPPDNLPEDDADVVLDGGRHRLDADFTCDDLTMRNGAIVEIDGDVTVLVTGDMDLNNAEVRLLDGARLTLYGGGAAMFSNAVLNGDSQATDRLTFRLYGGGGGDDLQMRGGSVISGVVEVGSDAWLRHDAAIHGSMTVAGRLRMDDRAAIHLDAALPSPVLGLRTAETVRDNVGQVVRGDLGAEGRESPAVQLQGAGAVAIPHDDAYLLHDGSISFWFRADHTMATQCLVSKDATGLGDGGHVRVALEGDGLRYELASRSRTHRLSGGRVSAGRWHHAIVGWGSSGMVMYLDGAEVATGEYTGGLGTTSGGAGNSEPLVLGADSGTSEAGLVAPLRDPFTGRLDRVRIWDQRLTAEQAKNLAADQPPGLGEAGGSIIADTSGRSPAVDLIMTEPGKVQWLEGGGVAFTEETSIVSLDSASKIYDMLTATGQMTLEVIYRPDASSTGGRGRTIAAMSGSGSSRNFALQQVDQRDRFLMRTEQTSGAGTPAVFGGSDLVADGVEHVVMTYDGQNITIYRNGAVEQVMPRGGGFNWDSRYKLALGADPDGGDAWEGAIFRVAIYDRYVNNLQAQHMFVGDEPGGPEPESAAFRRVWLEQPD